MPWKLAMLPDANLTAGCSFCGNGRKLCRLATHCGHPIPNGTLRVPQRRPRCLRADAEIRPRRCRFRARQHLRSAGSSTPLNSQKVILIPSSNRHVNTGCRTTRIWGCLGGNYTGADIKHRHLSYICHGTSASSANAKASHLKQAA